MDLEKLQQEFTDLIILNLEGKTKEDIFLNIAKFAKKNKLVKDEKPLYKKFLEIYSLGTNKRTDLIATIEAFPYTSDPGSRRYKLSRPSVLILCRTKHMIDFNSVPARIVLASIGGPNLPLVKFRRLWSILTTKIKKRKAVPTRNSQWKDLVRKASNKLSDAWKGRADPADSSTFVGLSEYGLLFLKAKTIDDVYRIFEMAEKDIKKRV